MFSETRYALNGDLRVAYRASPEGPRDIVFVSNWFTNCEVLPELPSLQGWVDAIRALHPSEPMFTFWDYKRQRWERDAGLRLDHLLLNAGQV